MSSFPHFNPSTIQESPDDNSNLKINILNIESNKSKLKE